MCFVSMKIPDTTNRIHVEASSMLEQRKYIKSFSEVRKREILQNLMFALKRKCHRATRSLYFSHSPQIMITVCQDLPFALIQPRLAFEWLTLNPGFAPEQAPTLLQGMAPSAKGCPWVLLKFP